MNKEISFLINYIVLIVIMTILTKIVGIEAVIIASLSYLMASIGFYFKK